MSSLPPTGPYKTTEDSEFLFSLDPLGNSWSLYEELPESTAAACHQIPSEVTRNNAVGDQQNLTSPQAAAGVLQDKGLKWKKNNTSRKGKNSRKNGDENAALLEQSGEVGSSSAAKKLNHNAKERIRRMKINASFLALGALLPPDSRRSKKRWTAPDIVDRVLKYIPELENEVEALRSKKENVELSAAKNKDIINAVELPTSQRQSRRTISVNKVNQEEAIVQICLAGEDDAHGLGFVDLLQSVEDEGFRVKSASTVQACEERICCHLHIQQTSHRSSEADCIEELISRLR